MTPRYAFYGDDFTGSTDVLEQLAEGGVDAVLFLRVPSPELLGRFPDVQAVGIAGDSRSRSPEWMNEHLPGIFTALEGAETVHYKTCSTFDSSPHTGSIGRALEIGLAQFGGPAAIVVGAPYMGRYVVFGNLFARAGKAVYRIDRHPTMSRHPVTPMDEADLIRHLARQTDKRIALVPITDLHNGFAEARFDAERASVDAFLFDAVDTDDLHPTGRLLRSRDVRFAVGSSGVTRALVMAWQADGSVTAPAERTTVGGVDRLLVVSGSCSPVTAQQIAAAARDGFAAQLADVAALVAGDGAEEERLTQAGLSALLAGQSCVIHSANGPLDERAPPAGDKLGAALGRIARTLILKAGIRRIVFAGGDTSSHGVARLGVDALTWAAALEPGAPLVRSHSGDAAVDGLEMVLKGGQIGSENFFDLVRRGTAAVD